MSALAEGEAAVVDGRPGCVVLDDPITLKDGTSFSEIVLSEPNVYHRLMATKLIGKRPTLATMRDSQIDLVARVAGWPVIAVQQLPASLLDEAIVFVTGFEQDARRPDDAEPDRSPSKSIVFEPAVEGAGRTWGRMELREPKVSERRKYDATLGRGTPEGIMQAEIDLVAGVSGWALAAVMRMPDSKFVEASEYLTGFFTTGRETGNRFRQT
nr:phage tail assembly protein [Ameyamaea chiangmaiensis]